MKIEERTCTVCGIMKQIVDFPKNGKDKEGNTRYRTDCKVCYNISRKLTKRKAITKFLNNTKYRTGEERTYTLDDWKEAMLHFRGCCAYCGRRQSRKIKLTKDHIIPVSDALGRGVTTKQNIAPACVRCNSSKSDHPVEEWLKKQSFYDRARLEALRQWMQKN